MMVEPSVFVGVVHETRICALVPREVSYDAVENGTLKVGWPGVEGVESVVRVRVFENAPM
jgi:hypothetical protein